MYWPAFIRDVLLELLASDDSMVRRAAAESLALMGLKIGDGYAVYLVQVRCLTKVSACWWKHSSSCGRDSPMHTVCADTKPLALCQFCKVAGLGSRAGLCFDGR